MDVDPKKIAQRVSGEATEGIDDASEGVTEAGKRAWGFLRSVWFWIIAGPVNMAIVAGIVIAYAFPFVFLGFPEIPESVADVPKVIVIDKDRQGAYAYENGKLKYRFVILTGMEGHDTPEGRHYVTFRKADHKSSEYPKRKPPKKSGGAPMPYTLRFTSRGHALHAGLLVGPKWCVKQLTGNNPMIGSHGCVNLTYLGSRRLFKWTPEGTTVLVKKWKKDRKDTKI